MRHDEETLGRLLGTVPPVPPGWVAVATVMPRARRALADVEGHLVGGPERDALTARLEQALVDEGFEPTPELVRGIRRRLDGA